MILFLDNFHFLRPAWWIALVPVCLILYALHRKTDRTGTYKKFIAPHLLAHLMVGKANKKRFHPLMILAVFWFFTITALAGPTFKVEPSPFSEDSAAVMIAIKVTDSMLKTDIQPSRLTRSAQKIKDLLEKRPGAKTGLVAYSGSAHLAMPLTSDSNIISSFALELAPQIMPQKGDNPMDALALCDQWLKNSSDTGSILLVLDDISLDQIQHFKAFRKQSDTAVHIFNVSGTQGGTNLQNAARELNATLTTITADDADVTQLNSNIMVHFTAALARDEGSRWKDSGYYLTPLVALIGLFWFRKGWVIKWD